MPRVRSLKPEFFTDGELAELSPLARLAFAGLWCHADRNGRLEDKPRELRVKILPYDDCDFDVLLAELAEPKSDGSEGFIRRYAVGGKRFISITQFLVHQKPHPKETAGTCPEPPPWEPGNFTATQHPSAAEQDQAGKVSGQSGGFLVLGSGSLVLGSGNEAPTTTNSPNQVSALGGLAAPVAILEGALPCRRDPESPGAQLRDRPEPQGRVVEKPTTPPETWDAKTFWDWCQWLRQEGGFIPEKPPNHARLGAWWSSCLMTPGVTATAMQLGFEEYGQDKFWEAKSFPFAGFMSQWSKFTKPEVASVATA